MIPSEFVRHDLGVEGLLWVTLLGALSGAASLLVFRRSTKPGYLRKLANLIVAHLFEIQLFAEEPVLVLRAQQQLIMANGRLLLHLLRPLIILLIPFAVLVALAEPFFGNVPLRPGETALVTVQFDSSRQDAHLVIPAYLAVGIKVDAPPVHIPAEGQIVWRIRSSGPASGNVQITTSDETVSKQVTSASGLAWAPMRRSGLSLSGEGPLLGGHIESIDIGYPSATIFHIHWLILFSLASLLGAGLAAVAI